MHLNDIKISNGFAVAVIVVFLVFLGPNIFDYIRLSAEALQFKQQKIDRKIKVIESLKSINIQDKNLLKCIREHAERMSEIHPNSSGGIDTVQDLRFLDCANLDIKDLEGIQQMTSLQRLLLQNNQITDLSPLGQLDHITHLDLNNNQVKYISKLINLNNLISLHLRNNPVADFEVFNGFNGLTEVYLPDLSGMFCADIEALLKTKKIRVINSIVETNCIGNDSHEISLLRDRQVRGESLTREEEIILLESEINRKKWHYNQKYKNQLPDKK